MLGKMVDPEIEHFHVFLLSEIHPYDLAERFTVALRDAGYGKLDPYYLASFEKMWIGYVLPGTTSLEFVVTHSPGTVLESQKLTPADRAYGGDGFTVSQFKTFVRSAPYEMVTLGEIRQALEIV